ncbi:hypothetical protein CRI77_03885 [Mycolicibacterium duvalii]|uniref:Uncharacterized protein n=1 Tax=Mycolicibacterium duvalii TaxID=39688 RepID=A0A7I7K8D7_9MYCO|nr:hypothetical protein [Mycolicibacterium duvalii]MCV7366486.1 hypothetical protein [Mycolicibacterium duvalii]PEG43731.1 hypothetical protein CRI77_03885 [Mycolicibacterium duvalii]BBX20313.1 hypothetical protein MDUV_51730 [Mycolicibacterium duvalii]
MTGAPKAAVLMALCALLATAPTVGAQPSPALPPPPGPPPVVAPPPPAHPLAPLAQSGSPAGLAGIPPGLVQPFGQPGSELTLSQHAVPSVPGTAPATPPQLNPFNNQYLLPQHIAPAAPGEGELFGIAPGQERADVGAGEYLRRLWETYQAGGLEGGLLGQRPMETLNQPLETTVPVPPP